MGLITNQQLATFYDEYRSTEVTFTKQINQAFGVNPKQIFLKVSGDQMHCIIYSSSMESAKVLLNLDDDSAQHLLYGEVKASLRYSIKKPDAAAPISFFIPGKITSVTPYSSEKPNLKFLTITFTQRPPDDLIEMLGVLLETAMNSQKRNEERISITPNNVKLLGFQTKEISLSLGTVSLKGILRDVSFSGAQVITLGGGQFPEKQEALLKLELEEKMISIPGSIVHFDPVEGQKGLSVMSIAFIPEQVPMEYKIKLNDYFSRGRLEISPKEETDTS